MTGLAADHTMFATVIQLIGWTDFPTLPHAEHTAPDRYTPTHLHYARATFHAYLAIPAYTSHTTDCTLLHRTTYRDGPFTLTHALPLPRLFTCTSAYAHRTIYISRAPLSTPHLHFLHHRLPPHGRRTWVKYLLHRLLISLRTTRHLYAPPAYTCDTAAPAVLLPVRIHTYHAYDAAHYCRCYSRAYRTSRSCTCLRRCCCAPGCRTCRAAHSHPTHPTSSTHHTAHTPPHTTLPPPRTTTHCTTPPPQHAPSPQPPLRKTLGATPEPHTTAPSPRFPPYSNYGR